MAHAEVDSLFARFQATGDPKAIAEVYESVAPDLLLIAVHVGHRKGDAEDLVQATFLAALETSDSYDASRPLLPWLIGILINQARREHRRHARSPDPDRLPPRAAGPVDPALAAEDAEFAESLARTIGALPPYYRQVLTLRWVHGLEPVEIAHSLCLPPGTVKTRLRRGTEILRQALPAGFAASTAILAATSKSLAAVKVVVVARAEAVALARGLGGASGTGVAASLTGWGKGIAGVLLMLAVITASLFWSEFWSDRSTAEPGSREDSASVPGAEAVVEVAGGVERNAASPPRREVAGAESSDGVSLVVHVEWHDGEAAAGVFVGVQRADADDPLLHEQWVRTGAGGVAIVRELAPGRYLLVLDRGGGGECMVTASGATSARLVVPHGLALRGTVVDGLGAALVGAGVWVSRAEVPDEGRVIAWTDAGGSFAVRDVAPGRTFSIEAAGYVPPPLVRLHGQPGDALEHRVDMTDHESRLALEGRVLDPDSKPIGGALIQIGDRLRALPERDDGRGTKLRMAPIVLRTDEHGGFATEGLIVFNRRVMVWVRAPGFAPHREHVLLRSRRQQIEITLQPGAVLSGIVLGPDGRPRNGVAVTAQQPAMGDATLAPRWVRSEASTDDAGRFCLRGLRGQVELRAVAPDGLRASAVMTVEGAASWEPVLEPPRRLTGFVTDEDGVPVSGVEITALAPPGRIRLTPAVTDERGSFRIEECEDCAYRLHLRQAGGTWSGRLASRADVHPDRPVQIEMPREALPTAAIAGRVVDQRGQPLGARMFVGNLVEGAAYARSDPETGRFHIAGLPPLRSRYLLWVETGKERYRVLTGLQLQAGETHECGDIVLEPVGELVVRLLRPDGSLWEEGWVRLSFADGTNHLLRPAPGGICRIADLAPGSYLLHLTGTELAQTPTALQVRPGVAAEIDVTANRGELCTFTFSHPDDGRDLRLDLRWLDAQGRHRCTDRVQWRRDLPLRTEQRLDPGDYVLEARSHAGLSGTVRFRVPLDGREVRVVMQ